MVENDSQSQKARPAAWGLALACALAACDAPAQHQASATTSASAAAPSQAVIPGTPPGDLGDWVGDIRKGVAAVPTLALNDPAEAQRTTLDLYVTRQEYAEMYYGADGRYRTGNGLGAAVETAEARFHDLMKLFTTGTPSPESVSAAVTALDEQQALVAKLWRESGARIGGSRAR